MPCERGSGRLLLTVRDDDRGVDVEHHHVRVQVAAGDPGCRHPTGQQGPHPGSGPGPRLLDPLQGGRGQLVQGPPHRRRRGHHTQHVALVAQGVDVGDRLTARDQHRRHVDQDPPAVMNRGERATRQRRRQLPCQAGPVGQQPHRHTPRVGHHAGPIPGHRQPRRPRRMLHLPGAFPLENLNRRKSKYPVAGQAPWCIPGPCQVTTRERSRLIWSGCLSRGRAEVASPWSREVVCKGGDAWGSTPGSACRGRRVVKADMRGLVTAGPCVRRERRPLV